jgi:hypothetical protein
MPRLPLAPSPASESRRRDDPPVVNKRGATAGAAAPRAWQRMLSGRRLDLLDPSALDIEIEDIAHGLARVARWNGQTSGPYIFSVAQHSLLVETLAHLRAPGLDHGGRLTVLLHDAPEYVIGDMISPFKVVIGAASACRRRHHRIWKNSSRPPIAKRPSSKPRAWPASTLPRPAASSGARRRFRCRSSATTSSPGPPTPRRHGIWIDSRSFSSAAVEVKSRTTEH